jgi:alkylation response protein AidB-like acyl-CoA dehydrogenase
MDFAWTEEQQRFREELIRFGRRELNEDLVRRDADEEFPREAWKRCAALGIQGLPVPEEYGGGGADPLTIVAALEALGYACRDNGLLFSLNAHMWSCEMPLVAFGTEEQKRRYLPGLADGSLIGVQAMTEPESGSDAFSLSTTARPEADGFVLRGTKSFITNAPVADVFVVFATTDRAKGLAALCAFLVGRDAPGLSLGPPLHKMGLRTSPMSEVAFDDVHLPGTALLGSPGAGMAVFNHSMEWERSCILACAVGTMQRQVERCVSYARERKQFGRPIGDFQSVSGRIVGMKLRLETSRLLLYHLAWLKGRGRKAGMEAAMVKLHLSEAFVRSSMDAVQIHGAAGYTTDLELERDLRDAVASRIYSGTSEIQRNIVAAHLGL